MANSFPLTFVSRGDHVTLTDIRAGDKLRQHLGNLGLHIGARVRIVQTDSADGLILAVKNDVRLALARATAQKIMVSPVEGGV
ncbi:MAG: ferrous iron transport protein A [Anaerolineae bacterium]|nr:ferrous iron transport protein A [Anaerolineae bacterium]